MHVPKGCEYKKDGRMTDELPKLLGAPWQSAAGIIENKKGNFADLANCRRTIRSMLTKEPNSPLHSRIHQGTWDRLVTATKVALERSAVGRHEISWLINEIVKTTHNVNNANDAQRRRAKLMFLSLATTDMSSQGNREKDHAEAAA